jgi:hypothetical protein
MLELAATSIKAELRFNVQCAQWRHRDPRPSPDLANCPRVRTAERRSRHRQRDGILAAGDNKALYVLELKLSKGPDAAVGQTRRYMAAVRATLAQGNPVFGVIVASEVTDRLRYAVSEVRDRVFLLQYELQVSLQPVEAMV